MWMNLILIAVVSFVIAPDLDDWNIVCTDPNWTVVPNGFPCGVEMNKGEDTFHFIDPKTNQPGTVHLKYKCNDNEQIIPISADITRSGQTTSWIWDKCEPIDYGAFIDHLGLELEVGPLKTKV
jgi:hypothetical protein